jgi:Na+-translocating ferredoxin:NAD+ oxidoreductase subunit E
MPDGKVSDFTQFKEGVVDNNPVLVQLLCMCPALAVSNTVENALVMGGAATFVVVMSNLVTSLLRHQIKPHVRILIFTLTIATFVTIADLFLRAHLFEVSRKLGPFVPLIIVNCMIISRAEVVAIRSGLTRSLSDAFGIGVGFTLALSVVGVIREILGSGTLLNYPVTPASFEPHLWIIMVLPPGAFLTLGVIIGIVNYVRQRDRKGGAV